MAVLVLCCCSPAFSGSGSRGYSAVAMFRLLFAVASLAVGHRLQGAQASVIVLHTLNCPSACDIFLDEGLNL